MFTKALPCIPGQRGVLLEWKHSGFTSSPDLFLKRKYFLLLNSLNLQHVNVQQHYTCKHANIKGCILKSRDTHEITWQEQVIQVHSNQHTTTQTSTVHAPGADTLMENSSCVPFKKCFKYLLNVETSFRNSQCLVLLCSSILPLSPIIVNMCPQHIHCQSLLPLPQVRANTVEVLCATSPHPRVCTNRTALL